ncbi:MAG: hypothetical protein ACTTKD_07655 [Peptoanaerobacter stomatis]|uniref:hypothetical protein n=1 Tax=Peptoanaerobacter stomatis TaxID=796937 RepID=UPI003FA08790
MEDSTIIATTLAKREMIDKIFAKSMKEFDASNKQYSAYLKGTNSNDTITHDLLQQLAQNCRNELENIVKINSLIEKEITLNGIIGKTYEAIETNLNTDYKLTYKDFTDSKIKLKQVEKAKNIINNFNESIEIETLMSNSILNTYATGNEILYLRGNSKTGYIIDNFPLKVAIVSPYKMGNDPVCLINVKVLEDQLKKTALKLKSGKAMFFDNTEKEIKANYPEEVYKAYKNRETYAILNPNRTYIMRINNMNKKYGLSPIFKALDDNLMLQSFKDADRLNAKARAKKILAQFLNEKLLENNKTYGYDLMTYAHNNLMQAWRQEMVITTPPACVERIEYIEPKVEMTDQKTYQEYKNNVYNALGVGFLSNQNGNSVSSANISIKQLMNTINAISRQFENAMNKFYKVVLSDNGIKLDFLPKLTVVDSELMEFSLRKELSEFVFNRLNSSYETAYNILGFDVEDEKQKRINENNNDYENIFVPHQTSATLSSKQFENNVGRPSDDKSDNPDKQAYDKDYNDNERE